MVTTSPRRTPMSRHLQSLVTNRTKGEYSIVSKRSGGLFRQMLRLSDSVAGDVAIAPRSQKLQTLTFGFDIHRAIHA
jgi:hypothetical protein